ncbi:hypothetical protein HMPREF9193_02092 [Treponema lecithinolyticum ATCC 700332]|uniref:Uncharacterized protein n=1 Tax=Treponema lecithinolyticum ATCC 700332 TaxID=1321815 RepID=A0ABN0NWG3_TRELE|nr:hypothetical protein HMPREF9193_02092 [Treponema lecithinolyticum ATCC 700332]
MPGKVIQLKKQKQNKLDNIKYFIFINNYLPQKKQYRRSDTVFFKP